MNKLRITIGDLFSAPMNNMSYISYMSYVNEGGKITARSLLDLSTVMLTWLEEQEKKNAQYEANFKEIEEILKKLVIQKAEKPVTIASKPISEKKVFICSICKKEFPIKLALSGHFRSHKVKKVL